MTPRTKVFVVDDHRLFRAGVRAEIADRVWVCGEAADVDEAVAGITRLHPDVVLLDVHLPGGGGRTVIERCSEEVPSTRFLALSASDDRDDVVAVVRAGARGYLTKTAAPDELVDAIRRVAAGEAVFSPRLAGFVLDAFSALPHTQLDDELGVLTPREREVLQLLARGYTYREVADRLVVSPRTIESHASAVLRKLQLANRSELARWAAERGL